MLPTRLAPSRLRTLLCRVALLLLLGGTCVGSGNAAPLDPLGVDKFRELIDYKNDPAPTRVDAAEALTAYRRKMYLAVKNLPSLGEVSRVLLLTEWNLIEFDTESRKLLKQARDLVRESDDKSFQGAIQALLEKTADSADLSKAIVAEIKRETRRQLLERLETRTRFYLRESETEGRIAAANLLSQTMIDSRRQDRHEALTAAGMMRDSPRRETATSARSLRLRLAELKGDVRKLLADSNPQVQIAGIRALSDLEIPAEEMVFALKPLLTSKETPVLTRRAAAEALGHVLERVLDVLTNLMEESRPLPRLKTVEQILPVAVLSLSDDDVGVRRASLVACQRSARILDELTRNPQMPVERSVVFQPAIKMVEDALPKINAAARDPVPALRIAACRVLETLALSALRLRNKYQPPAVLPSLKPSQPDAAPPKKGGENNKGAARVPNHRGRRTALARPSQWAATRPLVGEPSPSAVTLGRPIQLRDESVSRAEFRELRPRHPSALGIPRVARETDSIRPAAFVARRMDDLPVPTPIPGFWNRTVEAMVKSLTDPDYRVRLGAVDVLETLGDRAEAAIPALVKALRDSNKFVRWGAARTLGRLAPHKAEEVESRHADEVVTGLVGLLNDREDIGVRQAVLRAIGDYGEYAGKAVPHLAQVINRGDKDYILAVLHTIQSIGTGAAAALPNVAWLLSDRKQPASIRIEAAKTLGRFGALARKQPRVLSVLQDVMLNDPDEDVRGAASSAVLAIEKPLK